jgi:hypothetical protein
VPNRTQGEFCDFALWFTKAPSERKRKHCREKVNRVSGLKGKKEEVKMKIILLMSFEKKYEGEANPLASP